MASRDQWREIALNCAKDAHQKLGQHLRGIDLANPTGKLFVFSNDPRPNEPWLRRRETDVFRALLDTFGRSELAWATYPSAGPKKEFTTAMIVDAEVDSVREIRDIYECALRAVLQEWRGELRRPTPAEPAVRPICGAHGFYLPGLTCFTGNSRFTQHAGDSHQAVRVYGFHRD
jgi:hypothetical protein